MVAFIDDHRDTYGVEPICAQCADRPVDVLPAQGRSRRIRRPRSARAQRDDELRVEIQRVWDAHHQVYGPRKVWRQLRREEIRVARCTVRRLMRALGLAGPVRGPRLGHRRRTPIRLARGRLISSTGSLTATRPNQLWVSDFTYVATWRGFVYVAFVIDVFARRIVGWRVSASLRTDFVLDALEQAIYDRGGEAASPA